MPELNQSYRILALDDDINQGVLVQKYLAFSGPFQVDIASDVQSFWDQLNRKSYDLFLLDYRLPDTTGIEVLQEIRSKNCRIPVLMVTGQGDERIAVQAMQLGAYDYLVKTGDYLASLPELIKKAVKMSQLTLSVERSNEKLRYQAVLLNNMRDAVVVWNMNGEITFWNSAAYILFGHTPNERIGKKVEDYYLKEFDPVVILPQPGSTSSQEIERKYQTPSDGSIWISSRIMVLYDPNDSMRPIGYMDVSRNITVRKNDQQALFESEARYRAIVEDYQTEMICRFLWNGQLTFTNETYCRFYNRSRDDLQGENILASIDAGDTGHFMAKLHALSPQKPVCTIQFKTRLSDGSIRWLEWTIRGIFDDNNNFLEFQSVGRDITERKRMEAQIQASQAHLAQAARLSAIGELASSVAHLINNPMTTVIAEAQLMLQNKNLDKEVTESAKAIEEAGWRAQQVIQQLLEFSLPSADLMTNVQIKDSVIRALNLVSPPIVAMGTSIRTEIAATIDDIHGNPRQLEDLWVNLLLSMRANLADGNPHTIQIEVRQAEPTWVVVEISDDGKPIPPDLLENIFEPNLISPASGRGTGMELAICREIVRQHNGKINAINIPAKGTMFRVEFPVE